MTSSVTVPVVISFAVIEVHTMVRMSRAIKEDLEERKLLLEARHASVGDGLTASAIRELDNELYLVDMCLAKLWKSYVNATRSTIPADNGILSGKPRGPPSRRR